MGKQSHKLPYPGKITEEFPLGDQWVHVETSGTADFEVEVAALNQPWGGVRLEWSEARIDLTAPDPARDYAGQACLSVRLTPAEARELTEALLAPAGAREIGKASAGRRRTRREPVPAL